MNILRKIVVGLLVLLAIGFMVYRYWMKPQHDPSNWEQKSLGQISISSGRYPELLKQALKVKLTKENNVIKKAYQNELSVICK